MTTTDTPRTDSCPHCGDKYDSEKFFRYECGTLQQFPSGTIRTELCHQTEVSNIWQKRAKKAEAEVERLKAQLTKTVLIADKSLDCLIPVFRGEHEELESELKKIKATLNPNKK